MAHDVIVVGGGIAGLACAWRLRSAGLDVRVLEAGEQAGGNIQTRQEGPFRYERGPHTFMASAQDVFGLAAEIGLSDEMVPTSKTASKRFIVRDGVLHTAPMGAWSFLTTGLLSFRGKLKLMGEPFRTQRGEPTDSAMQFFERRFGPEAARVLAGAFISGVYAGDPERLSAAAAFPLFWGFEQEAGGMIRGARRLAKQRKAERKARGETGKPPKGLFSFRQGLGQMTAALADKLGLAVTTGAAVRAVARDAQGYRVEIENETLTAARLVVAVPPAEASRLVADLDPELAAPIRAVPMAPVAVVHLGFEHKAVGVPDGFGFLAPRDQGVRSLGVLFASRLFDGRAPEGGDLLSGFVGGMLDEQALALDDQALCSIVTDDLERLTGLTEGPDFVRVERYPQAIPQLTMGHLERMARVSERLAGLPGLQLAGNYLHGVGMKDAVASGFAAAAKLLERREDAVETA